MWSVKLYYIYQIKVLKDIFESENAKESILKKLQNKRCIWIAVLYYLGFVYLLEFFIIILRKTDESGKPLNVQED